MNKSNTLRLDSFEQESSPLTKRELDFWCHRAAKRVIASK